MRGMRGMRQVTGSRSREFLLSRSGLFGVLLIAVLTGVGGFSSAVAGPTPKWLLEFEKKCERGSMLDCQNAARAFAKGGFVQKRAEKDKKKAQYYIQRTQQMGQQGCDNNSNLANCHLLGLMYFEGGAINRDVTKGMSLINSSCEAGYDGACQWLYNKGVR